MQFKEQIDHFLEHLMYQKRYSKHTVSAYRNDLRSFSDYLELFYETSDASQVSSRMISSFMADLAGSGISPRSVHRKLSAVQSFYTHAMRASWVEGNPARKVQRPKMPSRLPKVMRSEQIDELFDVRQFTEDFVGKRDRAMLSVFYACGLRREELIGLTLSNIDFSQGQLKVLGKRNKERIVPFGNELKAVVQSYVAERKQLEAGASDDWLFLTEKGQKMYPNLVYKIVKNYLSRVTTMNQKSPHVLRHTFATHLLNEGANLQSIKELLGHSGLGTTQVYTHTSLEKLKDVYNNAHPRSKK